ASPAAGGEGEAELEIFSWWTNPGEVDGLQQLFDHFASTNPNVEIINATVAGGAGVNAQVALQTRLNGGDPPDSWQTHPGQELFSLYVDPGYCEPVTALWEENGWNDVYPQGIIDQLERDGEKWLVPVGVHRGNVVFYNKQVVADAGVEITDEMTVDQFFEIAEALSGSDVTALGLANQDQFPAPQLLENILLAQLGPEGYSGLWDGSVAWDSEDVTAAIDVMARMLEFTNDDYSSLTWDGAADRVIEGSAAMTSMGDWAWGFFTGRGVEDQIGYVAHPGTAGSFMSVIDGFTMPVGAPHPINAESWLLTCGNADAQTAFAPFKGAIPARTDVDTSGFNEYMQWSANDFANGSVVASMAHSQAASPQFKQSIFEATNAFLASGDTAIFQEDLVFAAEDAQLGG
ncbi:MAG TPA: ABC transporter substrate-binding protein, partial [Thermomicrobiales bacterium]|nr:ABC transporter substrate-binding protein [Thermomicrobiales bacterium]